MIDLRLDNWVRVSLKMSKNQAILVNHENYRTKICKYSKKVKHGGKLTSLQERVCGWKESSRDQWWNE